MQSGTMFFEQVVVTCKRNGTGNAGVRRSGSRTSCGSVTAVFMLMLILLIVSASIVTIVLVVLFVIVT